MLIGAMNHPARDVLTEVQWIADLGFDFVDLTLEPPLAMAQRVDFQTVRWAWERNGLGIVGHTAYYLPLCSPFESIRRAAVAELIACLRAFAELGAKWMNLHPDSQAPMHDWTFVIERNLQSLRELLEAARGVGVGLMIENLPGSFNSTRQLAQLLEPLPELGLHLDIGHANLLVELNTTAEILKAY